MMKSRALSAVGKLTADSELTFPMTWLTPAGFDWELWNATSIFGRTPPTKTMAREQAAALDHLRSPHEVTRSLTVVLSQPGKL